MVATGYIIDQAVYVLVIVALTILFALQFLIERRAKKWEWLRKGFPPYLFVSCVGIHWLHMKDLQQ